MIAAFAALASSACSRSGQTGALAQETAEVDGRVQVVGATPLERVVIEPLDSSQSSIEVRGPYRDELRRLSGAIVRVGGAITAPGHMNVQEYEILEIAGHVPKVGTVELAGDRIFLRAESGVAIEAKNAPAELLRHPGAKVWVILDSTGAVTGYGIIRER